MAQEQTFRAAGYYDREIDQSTPTITGPVGVPAGVIGTANKGPAFVPVTVANFDEFVQIFGNVDPKKFGPYAVNEFLKNKAALTYLRVLGAGANTTSGDIATTQTTGRVLNAGVKIEGSVAGDNTGRHNGAVQFLVAQHSLTTNEAYGMPMFTDNSSFAGSVARMVRGMVLLASGARMMVLNGNESAVNAFNSTVDDRATISGGVFKLVISSTLGNEFASTDGNAGVKIFTASFDPTSTNYFAKVMNRDPDQFVTYQHLLYADFAVDAEVASATLVDVVSGSASASANSGDTSLAFRNAYGAFDARYATPQTPSFISQPFGNIEYDLFSFAALDDGEYANKLYKIAISNIKASVDESNPYGTFTVEIRDYNDTDLNPSVLERFPNCSLDPTDDRYVAKIVGDRHVTYNFDATIESERRVVAFGKYPNNSKLVRIVMNDQVERKLTPAKSLPFGFRGPHLLKTNDSLTDRTGSFANRLTGLSAVNPGAILPPIPFRYKVTKGEILNTATFQGQPGPTEQASSLLYWGVKFERNTLPLNANLTSEKNECVSAFTKFTGIEKLDVLVTGSGADTFNNNKFSLSKVALSNGSISDITSSISTHMREAAYVRNANLDLTNYTFNDSTIGRRVTLATILATDTAANFNRFSQYAKFATFMYGGYDGLNFLDRDARRMNDKSTSFDASGGAQSSYVAPGLLINPNGTGQSNSNVVSYKTAINIMTDGLVVNTNILAIPGIRESFLTDYAALQSRNYGLSYYIMDIPGYNDSGTRLYDDSTDRPDVDKTVAGLNTRAVDNNYVGTYFPDVFIDDSTNKRKVKVPASIAALGAIGFNDKVSYAWYAPAGFNRASLDFVSNVAIRLNATDRDKLYDSRINPIALFPRQGFVIWGQKTLQVAHSALDRVNVRRLLLEIKRIIIGIANKLTFEQNTPEVRNSFVASATLQLGLIQAQAGIESFRVIMNESNNTQEDIDLNKLNGRIIVVPTRTVEFVSIDFVISNSGVAFV